MARGRFALPGKGMNGERLSMGSSAIMVACSSAYVRDRSLIRKRVCEVGRL